VAGLSVSPNTKQSIDSEKGAAEADCLVIVTDRTKFDYRASSTVPD
jgi:hypothetical protein